MFIIYWYACLYCELFCDECCFGDCCFSFSLCWKEGFCSKWMNRSLFWCQTVASTYLKVSFCRIIMILLCLFNIISSSFLSTKVTSVMSIVCMYTWQVFITTPAQKIYNNNVGGDLFASKAAFSHSFLPLLVIIIL